LRPLILLVDTYVLTQDCPWYLQVYDPYLHINSKQTSMCTRYHWFIMFWSIFSFVGI